MDSKPNPVYEDFVVHTEWVHEAADDTFLAYLPGFKKGELKVQVTTGDKLRISGERPIGDNKFSRFYKEISIPSNCDRSKIRANFEGGMLHVKLPKPIVPAEKQQEEAKPSAELPKSDQKPAPQPPRPADVPQKQKNGPEPAVDQEVPPKAAMEKQTGEKTDRVAKEADNVSQKAPDKDKAANGADEKPMEEEKKGSDQEEKATSSSEKREKLGDSVQDAAKKENIEPKKFDGADKYQLEINYMQVLDDLVKRLKDRRKVMNMVLAFLLAVVLAVYIRNAIRSLTNYWN